MVGISAFMVTHNAMERGEPFVESVVQLQNRIKEIFVIDRWSTDDTATWMKKLNCTVRFSTLPDPYQLYTCCSQPMILMIDPNEIIDINLLEEIIYLISDGVKNISIPRIEVTQNFQKVSWHNHLVHRVFPNKKVENWERKGVTTNKSNLRRMFKLSPEKGYLWAFTNNFLENWKHLTCHREVNYMPPDYFMSQVALDQEDYEACVHDPLWVSSLTPLTLPPIVRNLVGDKKYNPKKNLHKGVK